LIIQDTINSNTKNYWRTIMKNYEAELLCLSKYNEAMVFAIDAHKNQMCLILILCFLLMMI